MNYQNDNDIQIISEKQLLENVRKNIELKYLIPKVKILKESEFFLLEKKYNRRLLNKKRINNKLNNFSNDNYLEKKQELLSFDEKSKKDFEIIRKIEELKNKKRNTTINNENKKLNKSNKNLSENLNLKALDKNNNKKLNINDLIKKINRSNEPFKILNNLLNNNKNISLDIIKYYILEVHNLLNSN